MLVIRRRHPERGMVPARLPGPPARLLLRAGVVERGKPESRDLHFSSRQHTLLFSRPFGPIVFEITLVTTPRPGLGENSFVNS